MAYRIRVYPQYGGAYGAMGAMGAYGPYATQLALANNKLANVRETGNLKLGFLDALYQEKMKNVELQSQLKYGLPMNYGAGIGAGLLGAGVGVPAGFGVVRGVGVSPMGFGGVGGFNSFGTMGGLGGMLGGLGMGGQVNMTNQTSTGGANQTVTNSNSSSNVVHTAGMPTPWASPYGYGAYGYPQHQGLLGRVLSWF